MLRWGSWKYYHHPHSEKIALTGAQLNADYPAVLYNLEYDIVESRDVSMEHPEVVRKMEILWQTAVADLGDRTTKVVGEGVRQAGMAERPVPLDQLGPISASH